MSIHQRLTQLETKLKPSQDDRPPLLVEFIGDSGLDDDGKPIVNTDPNETQGILYTYGANGTLYLNRQQLADYKAKGELPTNIEIDSVYSRSPNFRIDNSKTERASG